MQALPFAAIGRACRRGTRLCRAALSAAFALWNHIKPTLCAVYAQYTTELVVFRSCGASLHGSPIPHPTLTLSHWHIHPFPTSNPSSAAAPSSQVLSSLLATQRHPNCCLHLAPSLPTTQRSPPPAQLARRGEVNGLCQEQLQRVDQERGEDVRLSRRTFRRCTSEMKRFCEGVEFGERRGGVGVRDVPGLWRAPAGRARGYAGCGSSGGSLGLGWVMAMLQR
jgi:hypothetical protein